MKKILLFIVLWVQQSFAQQAGFCASTERQLAWFKEHPELQAEFESRQKKKAAQLSGARKAQSSTQYTIPVVFHILHQGTAANISDQQVKDAVRILNRDFNGQNADTSEIVPAFQGKIANVGITFMLAKVDQFGTCTNGIIRHETSSLLFSGDWSEYMYTWPRESYLNIYVVDALPADMNAAAYTYLPGSGIPPEMDAIVSRNSYIGSIGTGNETRSRVLTHEVGHWLGLEHVWGWNQVGAFCGDDNIWDTPETRGHTSCDTTNAAYCDPFVVENVQNYMDYSYCCKMFTNGQADWMTSTLNMNIDGRDNLSALSNLYDVGLISVGDHCKPDIILQPGPYVSACIGNTTNISSISDIAPATNFTWTANNGAIIVNQNSSSTGVVITHTGITTLICKAANNAGSTSRSIQIGGFSSQAPVAATKFESFEENKLPSTWMSYGEKGNYWVVNNGVSYDGGSSVCLEGEKLKPGSINTLETPGYDLSNKADTSYSFMYAYARRAYHQDRFKVQGSTDCGTTWTDIYTPYIGVFANESGGIVQDWFQPDKNDWAKVELGKMPGFKALSGNPNVRFRFYFREDTTGLIGNRLFIDAINFRSVTALDQNEKDLTFNIYPQPSTGKFFMSFYSEGTECDYTVQSLDGKIVTRKHLGLVPAGPQELVIEACPAPGLYLLRLNTGSKSAVTKLVSE